MLLPSAMPCDLRIPPVRSSYSSAARILSPPPSSVVCQSPTSPLSTNIYSTCRALQSLLTTSLPVSSAPSRSTRTLASPIALTEPTFQRETSKITKAKLVKHPHAPVRRTGRKRRRSNPTADAHGPACDQENIATSNPSTPKRRRCAPLSIPMGLRREDFDALEAASSISPRSQNTTPHTPFQLQPDLNFTTPSQPLPFAWPDPRRPLANETGDEEMKDGWTPSDDNALVSVILDKFRLRQSDWDDCARRLGQGKNSIGERWRLLVGEGDGGIRRSSGLQRRKNVQLMEFGPEFVAKSS